MCIGTATKDYICFSPSVPVDQTWQAVKAQQEKTMKVTETPQRAVICRPLQVRRLTHYYRYTS